MNTFQHSHLVSAQNSKELFFRINMEVTMHGKIKSYLKNGRNFGPREKVLKYDSKEKLDKLFESFTLANDGKLLLQNKPVPTYDEAALVLADIHFGGDTKKHVYKEGRLLGALKEANFALPDFTGGLSRVVKE